MVCGYAVIFVFKLFDGGWIESHELHIDGCRDAVVFKSVYHECYCGLRVLYVGILCWGHFISDSLVKFNVIF